MQITKGEFLDTIFDCPFEMHELVEDIDIAQSIHELKDVYKKYYTIVLSDSIPISGLPASATRLTATSSK